MDRGTQLTLARALKAHVEHGTTALAADLFRNPVASYSDPERFRRKRERLFRGPPLFMGASCRLPAPGDYLTEEVAGVPVLLVRGQDGALKAFANICRHRAAPVAAGNGQARAFTCPYHGWTYGLDGALAGIPDRRSFPGITRDTHSLIPLPAAERHGLMFVRLAPGEASGIDLDAFLGGLGAEFASYDFAAYSFFAAETITPALNWKFGVDTFLEVYHLAVLHRNSVAPLIRSNTGTYDAFGEHGRMALVRPTASEWNDTPAAQWEVLPHLVVMYRLFPNTIVLYQSDHLETWRILPGEAPDRSVVEFALYAPEAPATDKARAYWRKNYDLASKVVQEEDFAVGERMQRGFMSGLQAEVVYGRNEPALIHFHQCLEAAMRDA